MDVLQAWVIRFLYKCADPVETRCFARSSPADGVGATSALLIRTELVERRAEHQFLWSDSIGVARRPCNKSGSDRLSRHPSGSRAVQRRGPGCMLQQDGRSTGLPCASRAAGTDTVLQSPQVTPTATIRAI